MSHSFRWGIIGTGRIASLFVEDLAHCPQATGVAVGSRSAARAEQFANTHNMPHAYGSYDDLVTSGAVDAVYIATPHPFHAEQALQCIEAGVPVLVEKPFAMTAAQADAVAWAAREAEVFAMEAMWTAFIPAVQQVLAQVEAQAIGPISTVRADLSARRSFDASSRLYDPELGGGVLLDLGVYAVWWAHRLLGVPASSTATAIIGQTGVEETVTTTLTYPDQQKAVLTASFREQGTQLAHVTGSDGTLRLHAPWWHSEELSLTGRDTPAETRDHSFPGHGYHFEAAHVQQCVQEGRTESPVLPLDESVAVMRILDTLRTDCGLPPWA